MAELKKMELTSTSGSSINLEALYQICPSAFTEVRDEKTGQIERKINFTTLRELLGDNAYEGADEEYGFNWVGKRAAQQEAGRPINKTLRPCPEESVDWEHTQNLYIEGDNLDVLKLLQKSYLGAIKMIYIDPPYNTGNDFVYRDDFAMSKDDYDLEAGNVDELGNRYRRNTDSNLRFHSDWCSMIYERLLIARNLLSNDGVIIISIDDNELQNLRKVCDEIFGASNFRNTLLTRRRIKSLNSQFADNGLTSMNVAFEYLLVYAKSSSFLMQALRMKKAEVQTKGRWDVFWSNADRPTMRYNILGFTPATGQWRNSKEKADVAVANYQKYELEYASKMSLEEYSQMTGIKSFIRRIPNAFGKNGGVQHWIAPSDTMLRTSNWTDIEVSQIGKEINLPFDNPKNKALIVELLKLIREDKDFLILDFFSGSATTAHAIMQLNADDGGHRKYIMVQIPEETEEESEARLAGYSNICEIGKERIRRAGAKIKAEHPKATNLDTGFRVFKLDESNMEDVYFAPSALTQDRIAGLIDNVKQDRNDLDLLFGCMLDWGVQLSLPLSTSQVGGKTIHNVNDGELVACFADGINEDVINAIAELNPLRVVFRDSGFESAPLKINLFEMFKQKCGWSEENVADRVRII